MDDYGNTVNNISRKKPCRILINNLYSITGLLQLKSVGLSDKPQFYSCVFYGDNVGWATAVGEKLLKDLGTDGDAWDNLKGAGYWSKFSNKQDWHNLYLGTR